MAIYKFSNVGGFGTYQRYNDFLAGNPAVILDAGAYFPLGEFTLASGQATIDFTNIPQTFTHLQIRLLGRNVRASSVTDFVRMRFNNDSGSNYYQEHALVGNGSSATSIASGSGNSVLLNPIAASTAGANIFAVSVIDILDYTSTNKNKTVRYLMGFDNNGSGEIRIGSGLWFNSTIAGVNRITLTPAFGDWVQHSSFSLYGVLA
jgi:hypothetical protein